MGVPIWLLFQSVAIAGFHSISVQAVGPSLGCFFDSEGQRDLPLRLPVENRGQIITSCISSCYDRFFRYAGIQNGMYCFCGSKYGQYGGAQCDKRCDDNGVTLDCGGEFINSVYETNQTWPGPPKNVEISSVTSSSLKVKWDPPEADNGNLLSYRISASPMFTYAGYSETTHQWTFPNSTKHYQLLDLHPGTTYNISIQSVGSSSQGFASSMIVSTKIGDPEIPDPPVVIEKYNDNSIKVQLHKGISYNGPVTAYQVVVVIGLGSFNKDLVDSCTRFAESSCNFYIAAEIPAQAFVDEFIVGDGKIYGAFHNKPLTSEPIQISQGVVSSFAGDKRVVYSVVEPKLIDFGDAENLDTVLKVAIIICTILLLGLAVAYLFLRRHFSKKRRLQMSSYPHELSVHGPMIEVENHSYIPEEEELNRPSHYDQLKSKVWLIPMNQLDIDTAKILGQSSYGVVVKGTIKTHNDHHPENAIFCIKDGELSPIVKRMMLQDLDQLIRVGSDCLHVSPLVGTCETPDMLYVVLDHHPATLKDVLLESRALEPAGAATGHSACTLSQQTLLHVCTGIARGMDHLASSKIIHKQLSAFSVVMAEGLVPKITNFGISKFNRPNETMDFTRWTAHEALSSNVFLPKSDVWSMGVLLWEVAALGGTPFAGVRPRQELVRRITRGMLPHQPGGTSNDLYQLMLQCWQLDLDERPSFDEIITTLSDFVESGQVLIDWSVTGGFKYEPYVRELERLGF